MEITKQQQNELLKRRELKLEMEADGATPSNEEIKKKVAEKTQSNPELVIIHKIKTSFGSKNLLIEASVYKDKESMKIEEVNKKKKEEKK